MEFYRFFFSYASDTHRASNNYLERFFQSLCEQVALRTGERREEVGYRDRDRLTLGSFWGKDLVNALQRSRVLVSVISPGYLESEACGREVEFFLHRFNLLQQQQLDNMQQHRKHRIIPIFWIDKADCSEKMHPDVEKFLCSLQLKQGGMPENYPYTGLHRYYYLSKKGMYRSLIDAVATGIKNLSNLEELPKLVGTGDFSDLPSFFRGRDSLALAKPLVANGPKSTNVIYAVATRTEAVAASIMNAQNYKTEREQWQPFTDAPGATIEMATQEGLNSAGQDNQGYRNLGFPDDLTNRIELAKNANSPVLIALDRTSLRIASFKSSLRDYDELDYPNVGLVTAGGCDADELLLTQTMPTKYGQRKPNHLWTVPANRSSYVQGVVDVVNGLRRTLQRAGPTAMPLPATPLRGI